MTYRKKIVIGSVLLVFLTMAAYLAWSCRKPKVMIRCSRNQNGHLLVDMTYNGRVLGLPSVVFWLEGDEEFAWGETQSGPGNVPLEHVVYGELPRGGVQNYPANNVPPKPLPKTGILYVGVDYVYDTTLSACISSYAVKLRLTADGGVEYLGDAIKGEGLIIKPASAPSP